MPPCSFIDLAIARMKNDAEYGLRRADLKLVVRHRPSVLTPSYGIVPGDVPATVRNPAASGAAVKKLPCCEIGNSVDTRRT